MEIDNKDYKEVKIKKMVVDGKEQDGNMIYAKDTKDKQQLYVTIYTEESSTEESSTEESSTEESSTEENNIQENTTQNSDVQKNDIQESDIQEVEAQEVDTNPKKGRGRKLIYELFQKSIFHSRRS